MNVLGIILAAAAVTNLMTGAQLVDGWQVGTRTGSTPDDFEWVDGTTIAFEGAAFEATAEKYTRLPEKWHGVVTPSVWNLSRTAIGFNFRFRTDSPELAFRWKVRSVTPIPTMPLSAHAGLDVYSRGPGGEWWHEKSLSPDPKTGEGYTVIPWKRGREGVVYLPVRARPDSFAIGFRRGSKREEPAPHRVSRPIVHYGTSIVNGGSVSRAGLLFTSIYGRLLDAQVVDLGFSGAGRMELCMADLLAEIDASVYVLDCEPNMYPEMLEERYRPFLERLVALRPDVPVLMCGKGTELAVPTADERVSRALYERLRQEDPVKWSRLHYLSGVGMLPADGEATHEHVHPNDYGFMRMGRVYADALASVLKPLGMGSGATRE